jgi:uncharacterized membrane protein
VLALLKKTRRLHEILFMGLLSILCIGFSLFRRFYSGARVFLFLNWNLFLAFVPWALTTLAHIRVNIQRSKILLTLLLGFWLLFFPNTFYVLTDLFHLRYRFSMPVWFDLVLILSFAWTSLLFGFLSLWDVECILYQRIKSPLVSLVSAVLLFVGSFGVYLGRYLRWNSWDIITKPIRLFSDIGEQIMNPLEHQGAWGMTLFMGLFLNMLYWSFRLIKKRPLPVEGPPPTSGGRKA